jgi:hypothetical protein
LQVVALSLESLALVQPLLVFDVAFAILIVRSVGWDASRQPSVGHPSVGIGRVAREFGDHPDTAIFRMRWARAVVRDLNGQSIPRTRRIAAPDSCALGTNPADGLSSIRSA